MKSFEILSIRIDPVIFKQLKMLCVDKETSLQAYVTKLVEEALEKEKEA